VPGVEKLAIGRLGERVIVTRSLDQSGELVAELHTASGGVVQISQQFPPGSPARPATAAQLQAKITDCLAGLEKLYGLKFKSFHPVEIGLRYTVLEKGQADLSILFTTDPQLAAESGKFVILKDDKEVFPAGNVIFVTKKTTVEEAGPDYEKTVVEVQKGLTLEVMQELDARVELEKQTPKQAAAAYLKSAGYTG